MTRRGLALPVALLFAVGSLAMAGGSTGGLYARPPGDSPPLTLDRLEVLPAPAPDGGPAQSGPGSGTDGSFGGDATAGLSAADPGAGATAAPRPTADRPPPTPEAAVLWYRDPRVVFRVHTQRRVVALTFDDGWSPRNGHLILDILLRERVAATFFVNGMYLARDPALWRAIVDHGFPVANHTYAHRDVTDLTLAELVVDLERNARIFRAVTGHDMLPIFRPPYGAHDRASDVAAAVAGDPDVILWDAVAGDTTRGLTDAQMIRSATRGGPGSIVLMHVGPDATPRILEAVIASYRQRGFSFVTIPQLLPADHAATTAHIVPAPASLPTPMPLDSPAPSPTPVATPDAIVPEPGA